MDSARGINSEEASTQSSADEPVVIVRKAAGSRTERRVCETLCKHLILEIFFEVNKKQLAVITEEDGREQAKKDIQECMREVWRIFKSIVQGPSDELGTSPQSQFESFLDEDMKLPDNGEHEVPQVFDSMHLLILMNNLIEPLHQHVDNEKRVPLMNYLKMFKLLKNIVIHALTTIQSIQMEVFASNYDAFMNLIQHSIAYICSSRDVVPYDLCSLVTQLVQQTTQKARDFGVFLAEPEGIIETLSTLSRLMAEGDLFESWLDAMKVMETCIFDPSLKEDSREQAIKVF